MYVQNIGPPSKAMCWPSPLVRGAPSIGNVDSETCSTRFRLDRQKVVKNDSLKTENDSACNDERHAGRRQRNWNFAGHKSSTIPNGFLAESFTWSRCRVFGLFGRPRAEIGSAVCVYGGLKRESRSKRSETEQCERGFKDDV